MLTPNTILQNRYRIIRQHGQGGMGTVYEAIDQRFDSKVAIKETHFDDEVLRKQFEREARLLNRLRHPAMTRVIDHFSENDGQFLVMDFVAGEELWEMLQKMGGAFPVDKVLGWADQLLDALDYLHNQDPPIVHRDIKPQNLKLSDTGQIILLDFGLAKGFARQISRVTTSGSIFGYTPNYAPLEQIQGTGTDPRTDLYSLAATLYHLLTGVAPPDVLTRLTAITEGQSDPLRSANELSLSLPANVAAILNQAMAIARNQRFESAAKMRKALLDSSKSLTPSISESKTEALSPTIISPYLTDKQKGQTNEPLISTVTVVAREPVAPSSTVAAATIASPTALSPTPFTEHSSSSAPVQPLIPLVQSVRKSKRLSWMIVSLVSLLIIGIVIVVVTVQHNSNSPSTPPEAAQPAVSRKQQVDNTTKDTDQKPAMPEADFKSLKNEVDKYLRKNQPDQAHVHIDQKLVTWPDEASLHYLKAQVYGFEQNAEGAESELRRTLELNPNYLDAYITLVGLYINTNQQERAIAEYRKAADLKPNNAMAYTMIGLLEDSRNNYDAAVESYRKALSIDSDGAIAANNLAWIYAEYGKGDLDEAVRLAQSVVQRYPNEASFADTLGWVYFKKGLYAAAVEQLQKAVSKQTSNATYRYHLGMALANIGDKAGARRELEKALYLGGNNFALADAARSALASL